MAETTQFTIGAECSCTDGVCGQVTRVVIDPVAKVVTHLVVEPKHRVGLGRLVPLGLVESSAERVSISCTMEDFEKLDPAEETRFLEGSTGYGSYGPAQVFSWPYYGLAGGIAMGMGGVMGSPAGPLTGNIDEPVVYDAIPLGEVAVRRGEPIHAVDGDIGRVQGLVIDDRHRVTHVLVQEGHLWGRKQVVIPIAAVTEVNGGVSIDMTRQQVHDLPDVAIDRQES